MGGGGDQAAGAVGNGIVEEGAALISVGTSGVVFAAHQKPLVDRQARLHSFCHAAPGLWHSMGVMLSAGGSLRWLRETMREVKPGIDYPEMTRLAEKSPAGANGLFFLPYLTGERTPHFDPLARGVFFGISLKNGLGDLTRAVIEGVSFGLKDSVEIMKAKPRQDQPVLSFRRRRQKRVLVPTPWPISSKPKFAGSKWMKARASAALCSPWLGPGYSPMSRPPESKPSNSKIASYPTLKNPGITRNYTNPGERYIRSWRRSSSNL